MVTTSNSNDMMSSIMPSIVNVLHRTDLFTENVIADIVSKIADGKNVVKHICDAGLCKEETFLKKTADILNYQFMRLPDLTVEPSVLSLLPAKIVFQYNIMPIKEEKGVLYLAVSDPFIPDVIETVKLISNRRIKLILTTEADLIKAINKLYGVGADTMERLIADQPDQEIVEGSILERVDLTDLDQEASIVKFVNQVIWEAYKDRATDIHFEPMEDELRIRYRVDGVLHQTSMPPQLKRFQSAIISRIKVMSNMDIAEKRLPQDGRISLTIKNESLDIRVSTMPTVYGESISLRLLTKGTGIISLDGLGMDAKDEKTIRRLINKPHGILLVTGPTGSGKSTTLYACLQTINSIDQRIITIEDPIEYEVPGVNQIAVRPEIGLTFAVGLRHILRQDPDVVMVGEIRDYETAEIAIRASLTGHLVFSTLHTNDSAGAITRLLDMGVEPFLVASSVEAIIAQRLVRLLCKNCRSKQRFDKEFLSSIDFPIDRVPDGELYEAAGCEKCRKTGFLGRIGLFEILIVNDDIRSLITAKESAKIIKQKALENGMCTLRAYGWDKVLEGVTTVEEVIRVSEEDE
jgi:type II secretion system protein E